MHTVFSLKFEVAGLEIKVAGTATRHSRVAEMAKPSRGRVQEGCPLPMGGGGQGCLPLEMFEKMMQFGAFWGLP